MRRLLLHNGGVSRLRTGIWESGLYPLRFVHGKSDHPFSEAPQIQFWPLLWWIPVCWIGIINIFCEGGWYLRIFPWDYYGDWSAVQQFVCGLVAESGQLETTACLDVSSCCCFCTWSLVCADLWSIILKIGPNRKFTNSKLAHGIFTDQILNPVRFIFL